MSKHTPFGAPDARPLDRSKFLDPVRTATGQARAQVALERLETLWLNTGTLCNLTCKSCYIESSPRNDALVYLTLEEAETYLDEAEALDTREVGFTGGEPFMNPDIIEMIGASLGRGFKVLVLTNAMRPMRRFEREIVELTRVHGNRLTMRVSLDHYAAAIHEAERGRGTWAKAIDGLTWLARNGVCIAVAGRALPGETEDEARQGYSRLFSELEIKVEAGLVVFPQMDPEAGVRKSVRTAGRFWVFRQDR